MKDNKTFEYTLREIVYPTLTKIHEFTYKDEVALKYFEDKVRKNIGPNDYKTNVKGQMTSWILFNKDPEFELFIKEVFYPLIFKHKGILTGEKEDQILIKDSWGNILKKGESVQRHHHRDSYYSTVIYFDNIAPLQTDIGPIETWRGKVITLDGFLYHWVNPVPKERINLVFNWSSSGQNNR
tara:strand:- start:2780 stop:3325 length:546 start_codon:yes stop_codon:yes gene_type:complete